MKEHIIETVAGGLVVLATALLLVYGSKFAWEVVKSDYNDHQELVARETLNKVSLVRSGCRSSPNLQLKLVPMQIVFL